LEKGSGGRKYKKKKGKKGRGRERGEGGVAPAGHCGSQGGTLNRDQATDLAEKIPAPRGKRETGGKDREKKGTGEGAPLAPHHGWSEET